MLNKNLLKALLLASSVFTLAACNKAEEAQTTPQEQTQQQEQAQSEAQSEQAVEATETATATEASLGYEQSLEQLTQGLVDIASAEEAVKAQAVADNYALFLEQVAELAKGSEGQKAVEELKALFVANKAEQAYVNFAAAAAKVVTDVATAKEAGAKVEGWNLPVEAQEGVSYEQFKTDLVAKVKEQAALWAGENQELKAKFDAALDALVANTKVADSQADDQAKEKAFADEVLLFLASFANYTATDVEVARTSATGALKAYYETYVAPLNLPEFATKK